MRRAGIVIAGFSALVSVGLVGADEVVQTDGSVLVGAVVVCEGHDCWVASAHRSPTRLRRPAEGPIEVPIAPVTRMLVLTDRGEPVTEGSIRWHDDGLPEELQTMPWQADGGRLDVYGSSGVSAEVLAEGYAPALVRLEPSSKRSCVVLEPVRSVSLKVQPPGAGELLLATKSDLHLLSMFGSVAKRWEIPESGELELEDLPGNQPMFGVVFVPGWAPVVGPLPAGRSEITVSLAEGLSVNGTVLNEEGLPVAGVEVTGAAVIEELDRWQYTQRSETDTEGRFLLAGLLEGPVVVRAWKEGFAKASRMVDLAGERLEPIVFELSPGLDLTIIVVDNDTRPLPELVIRLGDDVTLTDSAGRAAFRGRKPGEEVELELDGEAIIPQTRTATVNGEVVRITVQRGGALHWPLVLADDVTRDEVAVRWSLLNKEGRETSFGFGEWEQGQSRAVIGGLRSGTYVVSVRIPGFEKVVSDPVDVALGELVVLPPASPSMGAAVFGRVVAAEDGAEIAGALIKVEEGSPRAFRKPSEVLAPRTTRSDADGSFHLGGLEKKEHRVRVEAAGRAPTVLDGVTPEDGGADLGTVELGMGLAIEGVVVDRQRRPVPSAVVTVREPYPYAYFPEAETSSDRDGRFRVERLTPGEWKVEAVANTRRASEHVDGGDDETVEVELTIGGVELEAQILRGGLPVPMGRVSLSSGHASTQGVVVMVDRGGDSNEFFGTGGARFEATVDSEGEFTIDGIDPGTYTFGYRSNDGRFSGSVDLTVPDVPRHTTIVRLPSGSLEGVVVDPDDRPVSGADVRFLPSTGGTPASAYTDGAGAFRIDGLPPGRGQVVASHDSFEPSPPTEVEAEDDVALGPLELRLGAKRESGLKVHISATSAGASGAPVTVSGPESRLEFTDSAGVATFAGLPDGNYHVCGRVFGGAAGCLDRTAEVSGSQVSEVDLGLHDGGWVEVVSSSSIDGGRFQVTTENGADLTRALFLGNPPIVNGSTAVFGPLLPGRYRVSCSSCTSRSSGEVATATGETAVLDLR